MRRKPVTPIIPNRTAVPSDCRISAPAAVAAPSAATPRMNASEVIRTGRSCVAASPAVTPSSSFWRANFDDQDRILGSKANEHNEADLRQDVDRHAPRAPRQRGRFQNDGRGPCRAQTNALVSQLAVACCARPLDCSNSASLSAFADASAFGQRNGGGEHAVRIEMTLQGSQPSAVAAVRVLDLFSIMWRQEIRVAAG